MKQLMDDIEPAAHQFRCSVCGTGAHCNAEEYDLREAWALAKQAGWRCKEIRGEWHRWCPSCVEDWARDLAEKRERARAQRAKRAERRVAEERLMALPAISEARH